MAPDLRGKTRKNDAELNECRKELKQHTLSFPRIPSHYCKATSNLLYMPSDLTLAKMYELYNVHCQEHHKSPLSYRTYRLMFQSMSLAFHTLKKDRCEICERFQNSNSKEKEEEHDTFQEHKKRAEKIREIQTGG